MIRYNTSITCVEKFMNIKRELLYSLFSIYKRGGNFMSYWINSAASSSQSSDRVINFYADDVTDITKLPKIDTEGTQQGDDTVSCKPCAKGSTCFVITTGNTYYLNSSGSWVKPT